MTWVRIKFLASCLFKGFNSWWLTGEGTLYVSQGFYMRGSNLSEQLKKKEKTKTKYKPSVSSLVTVDDLRSDNMTSPLQDQVLHKELGHSFSKIHISNPWRWPALCTNAQWLSPYRGASYLVPSRNMQSYHIASALQSKLLLIRVLTGGAGGWKEGGGGGRKEVTAFSKAMAVCPSQSASGARGKLLWTTSSGDFGRKKAPWHQGWGTRTVLHSISTGRRGRKQWLEAFGREPEGNQRTWGKSENPPFTATAQAASLGLVPHASSTKMGRMERPHTSRRLSQTKPEVFSSR